MPALPDHAIPAPPDEQTHDAAPRHDKDVPQPEPQHHEHRTADISATMERVSK